MKGLRLLISVVLIATLAGAAFAAERGDFQSKAQIAGNERFDEPVRVSIPGAIICKTSKGFNDLRLYDERGAEIPYVIYKQHRPEKRPEFHWKIIDYNHEEGLQTIIMERPEEPRGPAGNLSLTTRDRNFQKRMDIYASPDRGSWRKIAGGVLYDFSAQIDLRRTVVEFPETDARYLKVVLSDLPQRTSLEEDIRLRYKELEFTVNRPKSGEIKIDGFTSRIGWKKSATSYFDSAVLSGPASSVDEDGNTIISLGRVNLPIARISLKVQNKYYYRQVELWVADKDEDKSYRNRGRGLVFRSPLLNEAKETLDFDLARCEYVRLKVINNDNPALRIEEVKIEWVRRNLYFIPDKGTRYAVYFNGADVSAPRYELGKLIPDQYAALMSYEEWTVESPEENELYQRRMPPETKEKIEKYVLLGLVVLLMCGLGLWTFRLIKKIPAQQ